MTFHQNERNHWLCFFFLTSDCSKFDIIRTYYSSPFQTCDPKLFSYLLVLIQSVDYYTLSVLREKNAKTLHQEFYQICLSPYEIYLRDFLLGDFVLGEVLSGGDFVQGDFVLEPFLILRMKYATINVRAKG